jgi:hypothetical protein
VTRLVDVASLSSWIGGFESHTGYLMEHYYHQIDGWFDFQNIYSKAVREASDNAHFVEIGSWLGKSTAYMAVEIIRSGKRIKFDVIDTWVVPDRLRKYLKDPNIDLYAQCMKNLSRVAHVINPIRSFSVDAIKLYADESLDFGFTDADHSYEGASKDIIALLPKIKENGVLAGHDYSKDYPGVIKAVNELLKNVNIDVNSWWIRK